MTVLTTHRASASPEASHRSWTRADVEGLLALPVPEVFSRAQTVHRQHSKPNEVQISTLLSIKTGGCPEDCGYCSQSAHHPTGLAATKLMAVEAVVAEAAKAKAAGGGAPWL